MRTVQRLHRSGVGVAPHTTIAHTAKVMERSGIGLVAVIDDDRLVGVVTDRDLVRRGLAAGLPVDARIDSVMTMPALTIGVDAELDDAHAVFSRHPVRRLAVVDGERFVGVLSLDDLLLDAARGLTDLTSPLAAEIERPQHDPAPLVDTGA